jgi:hypothetical protein
MVSKITIFEPHFDGAQFGPASLETPTGRDDSDFTDHESSSPDESESSEEHGSKSQFTKLLQGSIVFVLLFVTLWIALSRLLQTEEDETE